MVSEASPFPSTKTLKAFVISLFQSYLSLETKMHEGTSYSFAAVVVDFGGVVFLSFVFGFTYFTAVK